MIEGNKKSHLRPDGKPCELFNTLLEKGMIEINPEKYDDSRPVVTFRTHGWLVREGKKQMDLFSGYIDFCPYCGVKL
jgi:hypothetical protein